MQKCIKIISKYKTIIQLNPQKHNKYLNGVSRYGEKYRSEIQVNNHKYGLGTFSSAEDAAYAYAVAQELVKRGLFLDVFAEKPFCRGDSAKKFWLANALKYCISVDF